jgi:DNA polymerase-4
VSKIILHVDLNAFFATAETIRDPSLSGKPLIVGSLSRRGVVSTASYEARKFGVHSAMPMYQALKLCPQAIVKECDFPYYEMLSRSFFAYLKTLSPLVEEASIDEGFVDATKALGKMKDPLAFLRSFQNGLLQQIGLRCSIGVAPTKFLAKMGSDLHKPMGLTIIRKRDIPVLLYPLPIENFYGIGKKTAPRLKALGIATIGDLAKKTDENDSALIKELGKFYFIIKDWVHGEGDDEVNPQPFDPKSIGHSTTFENDTSEYAEITEMLSSLAREVAAGAEHDGKKGKTVQLVVKDTSFKSHDKSVSFHEATNSYDEIYARALSLYEKNFLGLPIRLIGVTLQNLVDPSKETVQMSLWNYEKYEEMDKTKLLINELNRKLKKPALMKASEVKKDGHQ